MHIDEGQWIDVITQCVRGPRRWQMQIQRDERAYDQQQSEQCAHQRARCELGTGAHATRAWTGAGEVGMMMGNKEGLLTRFRIPSRW